jgi:hypothetical protein
MIFAYFKINRFIVQLVINTNVKLIKVNYFNVDKIIYF